jgi:hypothetical protein
MVDRRRQQERHFWSSSFTTEAVAIKGAGFLMRYLKWQCHEMNIFSRALTIKAVLFMWPLLVFTIFGCFFAEKIQFVLASLVSLTYAENPSSKPLQEDWSCFQVAACDSKSCSKSRLWFRKLLPMTALASTLEKIDHDSERKPEQKFWCGFWNNL